MSVFGCIWKPRTCTFFKTMLSHGVAQPRDRHLVCRCISWWNAIMTCHVLFIFILIYGSHQNSESITTKCAISPSRRICASNTETVHFHKNIGFRCAHGIFYFHKHCMCLISGFLFVLNCHLVTSRGTDFSVDLCVLFYLQFKATLNGNISLERLFCRSYFCLTKNIALPRHRLKRSVWRTGSYFTPKSNVKNRWKCFHLYTVFSFGNVF